MKKLMIAAAIVCAAAMAQATSYNWSYYSSNPVYDGYNATAVGEKSENAVGAGLKSYLVYFTEGVGVSQASLLEAIRSAGGSAAMTSDAIKGYVLATTATDTDGTIKQVAFTTDSTKLALDDDGKMAAYAVIFNADESMVAIGSATKKTADETFGTDFSMTTTFSKTLRDLDGTNAYGSTGWYSTVPEPTSGLLLLLGVAGLALRRRRA